MQKTNPVVWFEIYVTDLDRASAFYETVLETSLENIMDPTDSQMQMKGFPSEIGAAGAAGALVKMEGFAPKTGGTLVYFGSTDCAVEESRVEAAGGKVVKPKESIGEYGWMSLCEDTEGNMFGLHSME